MKKKALTGKSELYNLNISNVDNEKVAPIYVDQDMNIDT